VGGLSKLFARGSLRHDNPSGLQVTVIATRRSRFFLAFDKRCHFPALDTLPIGRHLCSTWSNSHGWMGVADSSSSPLDLGHRFMD
jgi:hypothetical protein